MAQTAVRAMDEVTTWLPWALGGSAATDAETLSESVDTTEREWRLPRLDGRNREQALYRLATLGV